MYVVSNTCIHCVVDLIMNLILKFIKVNVSEVLLLDNWNYTSNVFNSKNVNHSLIPHTMILCMRENTGP